MKKEDHLQEDKFGLEEAAYSWVITRTIKKPNKL
jgi:hypothetical protein